MLVDNRGRRAGMAIVGLVIVLISGMYVGIASAPALGGFSLAGIDARPTIAGVQLALEELNASLPHRILVLTWDRRRWWLTGGEIGAYLDVDETITRALAESRKRGVLWRVMASVGMAERVALNRVVKVDEAKCDALLARLAGQVFVPPRNASIDHNTGELKAGKTGRYLDIDRAKADIIDCLGNHRDSVVQLQVKTKQPAVTLANLRDVDPRYRLARFSTYFDAAERERVANIQLASAMIDGTIVAPGGDFSFNDTVGPRSLCFGFLPAPEIVKNRVVSGIGGGVCQVSSTLYNAVLLAGLTVTERRNHSRPLGYVPLGRDATVYYDLTDFCFHNEYSFPVVISSEIADNRLSVAIFGREKLEADIDIETTDVEIIYPRSRLEEAPHLPQGFRKVLRKGRQGYRVKVWRTWQVGENQRVELLSHDLYPAQERIILAAPGTE